MKNKTILFMVFVFVLLVIPVGKAFCAGAVERSPSERSPRSPWEYFNSGNENRDKGNLDQGIADYTSAIQADANCVEAYFNRGILYFNNGEFDKAIADFEEVLRRKPDNAEAQKLLVIFRKERNIK